MATVLYRSFEQRMEALERANYIRAFRKELKKDLKSGRANPQDCILEPPEPIHTMKLLDLLLAIPKYGHAKAKKVLVEARVSPVKTLGGLSTRQRTDVVSILRKR
jgi:hypothetical protein